MKFHFPSYMLGVATGVTGTVLFPRLRPVFIEVASAYYRLGDLIMVKIARSRENLSDLLAEARARARKQIRRRRGGGLQSVPEGA